MFTRLGMQFPRYVSGHVFSKFVRVSGHIVEIVFATGHIFDMCLRFWSYFRNVFSLLGISRNVFTLLGMPFSEFVEDSGHMFEIC